MDSSPVQPAAPPAPRSPVQRQTTPIAPPPNGGGRGLPWAWLGLGAVLLIIVIVVLVFIFRSGGEEEAAPTPSPATPSASPTRTATPTPSPSPTVNPADWTFEVLNGSGVTGAAAKASEILKERGYTVRNVGNTEEQNYEKTQLLVTAERSQAAPALLADLKTEFPVAEVDATLESTTVTARLIIGKDWEPPSASPTTSPKASPKSSPTPTPKP